MSEDTYLSILNAQSPINITGNIFICNQLCQLEIEYASLNQLSLTSASNTLFWNLPTSQTNPGKIIFNGGDNSSTKLQDYNLKEMIMVGPSKLLMNNQSFNFQLNFVHQSEDGKRNIVLIVFIQASDSPISRKTLPHRFFDAIIQNGLPTMEQTTLPINTITEWNPNELIPDDQSFYSFIGQDNVTNYIVFQNPIQMSTSAQNMLIDQVYGGLQIFNQNALDPKKVTNPENLILYGNKPEHNIIKKLNGSTLTNQSSPQVSQSGESQENNENSVTVPSGNEVTTDNESPNVINIPIVTVDNQNQNQTQPVAEPTGQSPYYQKGVQITWYVLTGLSVFLWLVYFVWNKMSFGPENVNILPTIISFILKISIIIKVISVVGIIALRYISDAISNAIGSAQFTKVTSVLEKIGVILYTIGYGSFVVILDLLVIYLFRKKDLFANIEFPNPNLSFMEKIVYYFKQIIKNTPFSSVFDTIGNIFPILNIPILDKIKQLFKQKQIQPNITKERSLSLSPNSGNNESELINPEESEVEEENVYHNVQEPEPIIPPIQPESEEENTFYNIQDEPLPQPPEPEPQPHPLPPRKLPPPLPPRRRPPPEAFVKIEEVTPENEERQRIQREEENRLRREEENRLRRIQREEQEKREMIEAQRIANNANRLAREQRKKISNIPTTNITQPISTATRRSLATRSINNPKRRNFIKLIK